MTRKRKRATGTLASRKAPKLTVEGSRTRSPVLASCYPEVVTLRNYFLTRLPATSRVRRARIREWQDTTPEQLLDTCLVGVLGDPSPTVVEERARELSTFTQSQRLISACNIGRGQACSLGEVIDFVVWLLFKTCPSTLTRPKHLLCDGLQKATIPSGATIKGDETSVAPGILQQHPNESLNLLKSSVWDQYLNLLGADGETIFSSLLFDCGLFLQLNQEGHNYLQVSGIPVYDLTSLSSCGGHTSLESGCKPRSSRRLAEISFVRNRMLYGKPILSRNGQAQFGLKHVHVLERYPQLNSREHLIHVMKHVFPRQFGLHNAFTSSLDSRESSQRFLDYTYREHELQNQNKQSRSWMPRRLRGETQKLVQKLRRNHARCSYSQLLRHYCPVDSNGKAPSFVDLRGNPLGSISTGLVTQSQPFSELVFGRSIPGHEPEAGLSFLAYATSSSQVSAFCQSVCMRLLPRNCFGCGPDGEDNRRLFHRNIDRFVRMRRFETLNLHEVCHGLRIRSIAWLQPPKQAAHCKMSKQDTAKRVEMLHELVYYIFDSLLIPLIRSNFYVTESGLHRYKLFYFRHDVWRKLSEPSLALLRINLYQPLKPKEVRQIFHSRTLGYSNVRLLPKAEGTRPITNLKRRMLRVQGGRRILGPSINSQLRPLFSCLGYERQQNAVGLKNAIFSIGGLHERLKQFRSIVPKGQNLYFVKVDIQSCFDTIPQARLLETVNKFVSHAQYRMVRYAEIKKSEPDGTRSTVICRQKFKDLAVPANHGVTFSESLATSLSHGRSGIVLLHAGNQKVWHHLQLLKLLREHVQNNVVKIGKKHFKQTNGIPQGSILSSLLCSLFYGDFELKHLSFLNSASSMLVRLIDDFLLITTNRRQATRFLEVMSRGHEEYGISVNPDKTLVNFEMRRGVHKFRRHPSRKGFPFCGMTIDTLTLEVRKDWQRKDLMVSNGLTVATGNRAAATFRRKVLLMLKQQMHAVLLDTKLNSPDRILLTYLEAFEETAMKMHQYVRSMPSHTKPPPGMLCSVLSELMRVAFKIGRKRQSRSSQQRGESLITKSQMCWLASIAFARVLQPKQSGYQHLLLWLQGLRSASESTLGTRLRAMKQVVEETSNRQVVTSCVY